MYCALRIVSDIAPLRVRTCSAAFPSVVGPSRALPWPEAGDLGMEDKWSVQNGTKYQCMEDFHAIPISLTSRSAVKGPSYALVALATGRPPSGAC